MRAFICVDGQDWEAVIQGAARYLKDGEAVLAHVVDERVPRSYDLAIRGLLGRRSRRSEEEIAPASEAAAKEVLAEAEDLLKRLRPKLAIRTVVLDGPPNERLMQAAEEAQTIFIGRGTPGARSRVTVSGVIKGWRKDTDGDTDGLFLDDGTEVRFPPHRTEEIQAALHEGMEIEAVGTWRGRHLHAYTITPDSGAPVEAHEQPGEGPGKRPLGHTARFIVDHALCDVVVLL